MEREICYRQGTQDADMVREVLQENEYRLPEKFQSGDIIVDVGAHIGAFAVACLERGAGLVSCWEPCPENVAYLRRNLQPYEPRAEIHHAAVGSWDGQVRFRPESVRTAMGRVAEDGLLVVPAIRLNTVLCRHSQVRLLKLDCEGSEFAALLDCGLWHRVQEVVFEYHLKHNPHPGLTTYKEVLRVFLEGYGFEVTDVPHPTVPDYQGLFFAWNRRKIPCR